MNRRRFLLAAACLVPAAASAQGDGWSVYVNDRFGTGIEYPSDLFVPGPAPTNNDGRSFATPDGRARFSVWGSYNALDETLAQMKAGDAASADRVTYEAEGDGWYVLSGYRGGEVFYLRKMLRDDVIHGLDISYDPALTDAMAPVVTRMSRSFGPR